MRESRSSGNAGQQTQDREQEESRRTGPLRYRLPVLKDVLKKPFTRASYLSYLFGDYRRILDFGTLTRVFLRVPFPPDVRLSPNVPLSLTGLAKPWAVELSGTLELALEDSWRYLRKIEYNLLVVLKQFCDKFASINFNLFNYRDRNLINKLRSLETLFLFFHCQPRCRELLLFSLKQVTGKDMRLNGRYEQAVDLMDKLLQGDCSTPSLYNFLLGLNMLAYRRFFRLPDLVYGDLGELVNTREFACTLDVKKKIGESIIEGRRRLSMLQEQQQRTKKLKALLSLNESGQVDFEPLRSFYERTDDLEERQAFAADSDNIMRVAPRLFDAFDRTFYPLLNGHVHVEDVGNVTLFTQDFFQLDFLRIRQVAERVEALVSSHDEFPRNRFLELQRSVKGILSVEADILKLINEGLDIICEMGKKVETVLVSRRENTGRISRPLDPLILRGKDFSLSHENKRISSRSVLNGKSVADALSYAVSICLTIAVFLHYPPVYELLEGEEQTDRELRSELETLSRLADSGIPGAVTDSPPAISAANERR
jgi:hypothetical protein